MTTGLFVVKLTEDLNLSPTDTAEKPSQDLIAGHPKSVIRQEITGEMLVVLKRTNAPLPRFLQGCNYPVITLWIGA